MAEADVETFTQLPITIDPASKALSSSDTSIANELADINAYHKAFLALENAPGQVPQPPMPVNPKRSVQITKLRESGNAAFKKSSYADAVKMYDLAIRMAADRPPWEASGLMRDELSALYNNRALALMSQQLWAEAAVDAELSVDLKRVGNVKGWYRRGQSLKEMGRLTEAQEWVNSGLEFERAGPEKQIIGELEGLQRAIDQALEKRG